MKTFFKRSILYTFNLFGLQLVRTHTNKRLSNSDEYGVIVSMATYSPWKVDAEFLNAYEAIKTNTLVDILRCYELWQMVEQSSKLESGCIIEVGAWRGGTGALMAAQAKSCGIQEHIYLCDTFTGVVKAGDNDPHYTGGEHADTTLEIVEELVYKKLCLNNVKILRGIFPDETNAALENCTFRLCHIDVDVYESAKDVLDWIWPKMVAGGAVIFDDYGFATCRGITKLVNEQRSIDGRIVIHNLNGHAIIVKIV